MFKRLSLFFIFQLVLLVQAQGVKLVPKQKSMLKYDFLSLNQIGITDTIDLPFFDDFSNSVGTFPNSNLWINNGVSIFNSFTYLCANQYAAIFDHIDEKGNPYSTINDNVSIYADSLTSQPINLKNYKLGPVTKTYSKADSVYLTFFWGAGGLGDFPELGDSLILYFKDVAGKWNKVWGASGSNFNVPISLAKIRVDSSIYLHATFQLKFVNFTKSTGNLNHFFIDYIALHRNRSISEKSFKDIGIKYASGSLLLNYTQMPYTHFKTSPASYMQPEHCMYVKSLHGNQTVQTRFGLDYFNQFGTLIGSIPLTSSGRNILAQSDTSECFSMPQLDTFVGNNPSIRIKYKINPQAGVEFPDDYNALGNNNEYEVTHRFNPWYAYDDGTAEGGIGLDYAALPVNQKGQFALKFNNKKTDSLAGVAIYFNQSKEDVAFRSFNLKIWKSLSPLDQPDNQDQVYYQQWIDKPVYTDSINGFAYILFDSAIVLPAGDFYVGWQQNQKFLLNIGYDNNYRYNNTERFNPNIFFNLLNSWSKGFDVYGTPMIRPIIGKQSTFFFSATLPSSIKYTIYPNPAQNSVFIQNLPSSAIVKIMAMDGKLIAKHIGNSIPVENLRAGKYILQIENNQNITFATFYKN